MATYSVTTTAKQDAILAYIADKRAVTVQVLMDGALQKLLQQYVREFDSDDGTAVQEAYLAATPTKQAQVKTALGL